MVWSAMEMLLTRISLTQSSASSFCLDRRATRLEEHSFPGVWYPPS